MFPALIGILLVLRHGKKKQVMSIEKASKEQRWMNVTVELLEGGISLERAVDLEIWEARVTY